jgi:enolase
LAIDTRTERTIEVHVSTDGGFGSCASPKGAPLSVSAHEIQAYPPGGVNEAIRLVNSEIAPQMKGLDAQEQERIDQKLKEIDGTPNFRRIGGNTSTALSIAVARAAADSLGQSLYKYLGKSSSSALSVPLVNLIGGGPHARDGVVPDFQEHHLVPVNAKSMKDILDACILARAKLREKCMKDDADWAGGMDDEGAWAPNMNDWRALELLTEVAEEVNQEIGVKMLLGIDCAAEHLWDEKKQVYAYKRERTERTAEDQKEYISKLIESFPIYYVEDIAETSDFQTYVDITRRHGNRILVCGDDLFACNAERLAKAAKLGACNSLIVKVNMVGTLTDTYRVVRSAIGLGYVPIQSRRSGETDDTTIADLTVAWNCPLNKFGFAQSGVAKQNRLLRIEEELGHMIEMPHLPFL